MRPAGERTVSVCKQHLVKGHTYLGIFIGPGVKRSSHGIVTLKKVSLDGLNSEKLVGGKEVLESDKSRRTASNDSNSHENVEGSCRFDTRKEMQVLTRISIGKNKVGCCALRRDILCLEGSGADNLRGKGPCLFMFQPIFLSPSSFLDKIDTSAWGEIPTYSKRTILATGFPYCT